MSKRNRWQDIFRQKEKPKTPVQVGDKFEELTGTQAYRFKELKQLRQPEPRPAASTAPNRRRNTL